MNYGRKLEIAVNVAILVRMAGVTFKTR